MKTSIERNFESIRFFADSVVAQVYKTSYYSTAEWRVRRAAKPIADHNFVIYSTGTQRGNYPYIGGDKKYSQMGIAAKQVNDSVIRDLLKQAQTEKGKWAEYHGAKLATVHAPGTQGKIGNRVCIAQRRMFG